MNLWKSMNGMIRVRLTSGDPAGALVAVNHAGITVHDAVRDEEDITVEFSIRRQDVKPIRKLTYRKGYGLKIIGYSGLHWTARRLLKRPVLLIGLTLLCALALYIQTRVLFVQIEGNETVPTRLILEKCEESGIRFGASRRLVRSEKVKNALLEAIPELQWAGVNTAGCVATITVKERTATQAEPQAGGVCSIVALCDGVITQCTVLRGSAVCRVGQAVRAGELLVSGYTDCGISIQAARAEAEIFAQTQRNITVVTPAEWVLEGQEKVTQKKYAIIIGKKRINFYKGSGISGASCDKMYTEYYITLPGGFQLPVAIVTEVWTDAEESEYRRTQEEAESMLTDFSQRYLLSRMVAGSILNSRIQFTDDNGLICLQGNYACTEMIAQVRNEEIIKPYGNDH